MNPTKTAMAAVKKLTGYLQNTSDMSLRFERAETYNTVFNRWKHLDPDCRASHKAHNIELFSDSDWASSKSTRKSTSSGLIFHNGHCIHSHSRGQLSVALSSMEAEILAATGLLAEGISVKQALQFLLGCKPQLGGDSNIEMKLFLDSTSAQAFFQRLGPGRAKHLCTRILWGQEAMRRGWFKIGRIATRDNPADLNTKALSKERREYLCKMIGLSSSSFGGDFHQHVNVRRIVQLMVTAGLLKGCQENTDESCDGMRQVVKNDSWSILLLCGMIVVLTIVLAVFIYRTQVLRVQLASSREAYDRLRAHVRWGRNVVRLVEENTATSESDNDDESHEDHDNPFPGRGVADLGDGYFAVRDTSTRRRRSDTPRSAAHETGEDLWEYDEEERDSWYHAIVKGFQKGGSTRQNIHEEHDEDTEAEPSTTRRVQHEARHEMMNPESDREHDEVDEEGEEHVQLPSSSRYIATTSMIAETLRVQAERIRKEREDRSPTRPVSLMISGSECTMYKWHLDGIPADITEFQEWRSNLRCMSFGLESDLTRICASVAEHIQTLQQMQNPAYHHDIRRIRHTYNNLQDLLLLCQKQDPHAYMSASFIFMKFEESGRSNTFFHDGESTELRQTSTVHDDSHVSSNAEDERSEPPSIPRLRSRGSEMSNFESWNEAHMISSSSEFEYNPGGSSTALRIVSPEDDRTEKQEETGRNEE